MECRADVLRFDEADEHFQRALVVLKQLPNDNQATAETRRFALYKAIAMCHMDNHCIADAHNVLAELIASTPENTTLEADAHEAKAQVQIE